ncbi:MAG: GNAT family N-acetyltransferase [Bacteriovoracaceae bacterium]|nr:GNAT family N-acetyltransferase [Bacteriovoracaceae bacterium]
MKENLIFEKVDPTDKKQAETYVSWYSNPEMVKNWIIQKEEKLEVKFTTEDFVKQFGPSEDFERMAFMLRFIGKYIGYGQFYINHPVCLHKEGRVAWPSIAIGADEFRGKGFGLAVAKEVLRLAKEQKCTHIEAGIFEFNKKMKSILLHNGFKLIGQRDVKTFVDNKWWCSEHYLLTL